MNLLSDVGRYKARITYRTSYVTRKKVISFFAFVRLSEKATPAEVSLTESGSKYHGVPRALKRRLFQLLAMNRSGAQHHEMRAKGN